MASPFHIWQITDGKRGHENQTLGLVDALAQKRPVTTDKIDIGAYRASWFDVARRRFLPANRYQRPALVIGAGSRTHSSILAASRATGAPSIVIMAPAKPIRSLFSLCILPIHDGIKGKNIITTKGALNRIHAQTDLDPQKGLMLIGGPSAHHKWSQKEVFEQAKAIANASPQIRWTATTSRRTPAETTAALQKLELANFSCIPFEETDETWLPKQLLEHTFVWVTEDSVSMIYEGLSCGASVGLITVPRKKSSSRIIRGLDHLIAEGDVLVGTSHNYTLPASPSRQPLQEADRVADYLINRFFDSAAD